MREKGIIFSYSAMILFLGKAYSWISILQDFISTYTFQEAIKLELTNVLGPQLIKHQ